MSLRTTTALRAMQAARDLLVHFNATIQGLSRSSTPLVSFRVPSRFWSRRTRRSSQHCAPSYRCRGARRGRRGERHRGAPAREAYRSHARRPPARLRHAARACPRADDQRWHVKHHPRGTARRSYAALRGSRALGFVSSSLRPTSRSDPPTSTAAPSRTNPATTGTEIATPVSCETRRTASRPTSLRVMAAS